MSFIYDVFRIEMNDRPTWLGVADTLVEARTLIQRDPLPSCRYLIIDSRSGEGQFVDDLRKAS